MVIDALGERDRVGSSVQYHKIVAVSEGDNMYDALKEAVELIHDLAVELEYIDAVNG
jgi:hypothetical protein